MIAEDVLIIPRPEGRDVPKAKEPEWMTFAKNISLVGGALLVLATLWRKADQWNRETT